MKNSRKTIALLICLVMCFALLAACNNDSGDGVTNNNEGGNANTGGTTTTPPQGSTTSPPPGSSSTVQAPSAPEDTTGIVFADYIEYIVGDAVSLVAPHNPAVGGSSHTNASRMIYDTLYYNNPDGTSVPMLATGYETSDYQTWTFTLRDDVYFHNGDKFTAADVVYTWQSATSALGTNANANWRYVVEANVINDYTVELKTATPYGNLLFNLGIAYACIVNGKAIEADPLNGWHVGTGAYKLAELSPSDYMLFERNDEYWGEPPYTKTQMWRLVTEASARTIMLQNGSAQLGGVNNADLPLFEADPNFRVDAVLSNNSMSIQFNLDDPICGDLNFRTAVAYAIDVEEIALFAMGSLGVGVTDGTIWGYEAPFKNTNIPYLARDLAKAKEFLDQSIYNGETIEFSIMSGNDDMAAAIQGQLFDAGINIRISPMDVPSFMAYTDPADNKGQMLTWFAGGSQNPVDSYAAYRPGTNRMGYNNPLINEMLDQAPSILGEAAQREHYFRMQEILVADRPLIPLYWMPTALVYPEGVGGFITSSSAIYDLRYTYQIIE